MFFCGQASIEVLNLKHLRMILNSISVEYILHEYLKSFMVYIITPLYGRHIVTMYQSSSTALSHTLFLFNSFLRKHTLIRLH